ncbi:DUF3597 domain-containing protein [Ramlibacter sp.]|uniref:DUF3597 domain-containing protein n=1 Tax=Ramlibacter sp. TaxID=1917967 RepID=UPI002FC79D2B
MSILGKIFGKIFPKANAAQPPAATTTTTTAQQPAGQQPNRPATQPQAAPVGQAAPAATMERVDIEQVLDGMPGSQKLNWRTSIVDLMKLVGMESSLQERKELADELGYTGDKNDSAKMNMWLHKEVMKRMEQNGGKVPPNLKD